MRVHGGWPVSFSHRGFDFLDDVTIQEIGGCRVHLGDLQKECTNCRKLLPLIDGFGQLRCMDARARPLEYRSQAQCKRCRGEKP
jgi:hypothetical protein